MADMNQLQQMLTAALAEQRAQMEAHVGEAIAGAEERFRNLQAQNAAQQQAGLVLEAQVAALTAQNQELQQQLEAAQQALVAEQQSRATD